MKSQVYTRKKLFFVRPKKWETLISLVDMRT